MNLGVATAVGVAKRAAAEKRQIETDKASNREMEKKFGLNFRFRRISDD